MASKVSPSTIEYTKDRYKIGRGSYNTLNGQHLQFFYDTLGSDRVLTEAVDLERYNVDLFLQYRGNSSVTLKPKTTEEVSQILSYCNKNLLAVCPQGGNTGVSGAAIPVFDEVVISTELMNNIIELDDKSGVLVCQAGCVLENLNKYLEDKHLIAPIDIGSKGSCQIGGNVSTNAGGFRLSRFGSLHGNVLGLEVVKANGEVLDCLKMLKKDNTGYHLKNLFIGAEGTLGVITKVALQCITKPKAINIAFLGIESYEKVLETYQYAKETLGEILSAAELVDAATMELVSEELNLHSPIGSYPFYLLIETFGSDENHDSEKICRFLEMSLKKQFVLNGTIASDTFKRQKIWKIRKSASTVGRSGTYVFYYDLTLSLKDYYSIVLIMREYMGQKALSVFGFGHLGDGNIHLQIMVPKYTTEIQEYIEPYMFKKVLELNGSISAEHCLGFKNAKYLTLGRNALYINTMKDLKAMMDPNEILNPYKIFPQ